MAGRQLDVAAIGDARAQGFSDLHKTRCGWFYASGTLRSVRSPPGSQISGADYLRAPPIGFPAKRYIGLFAIYLSSFNFDTPGSASPDLPSTSHPYTSKCRRQPPFSAPPARPSANPPLAHTGPLSSNAYLELAAADGRAQAVPPPPRRSRGSPACGTVPLVSRRCTSGPPL